MLDVQENVMVPSLWEWKQTERERMAIRHNGGMDGKTGPVPSCPSTSVCACCFSSWHSELFPARTVLWPTLSSRRCSLNDGDVAAVVTTKFLGKDEKDNRLCWCWFINWVELPSTALVKTFWRYWSTKLKPTKKSFLSLKGLLEDLENLGREIGSHLLGLISLLMLSPCSPWPLGWVAALWRACCCQCLLHFSIKGSAWPCRVLVPAVKSAP